MNKDIFLHKHICLVGDHSNPLGIIRSLGEVGIKPIVLLCAENPKLVQHSKYIGEIHYFKSFKEGFCYLINHYSNEKLKPFIYNGSDDTSLLLDKHYLELKDRFFFTNGQGALEKYLDKYELCNLALNCGIDVPQEELLTVGTLPTTLKYPVITKAVTSATGVGWKEQSFICENKQELLQAYKKINAQSVLVQEYIRKKNELCIDGISINGGEQIFMPYACSYYRFPQGSYGNYMYYSPFRNDELIKKITMLIRRAKFSGIFCIEFLIGPDDKLYFLEVNFRNSGWSYAFTYGGYNLPIRWAISSLEGKISKEDFQYLEKFNAMEEICELRDCKNIYGISFWGWLKDFLKCDCCLIYNKKDIKPFIAEVYNIFKRKLSK